MNHKTHLRVIRCIGSALLGSSLTPSQLIMFSKALRQSPSLAWELSDFIEELAHMLPHAMKSARGSFHEPSFAEEVLLDTFRDKRLSKAQAIDFLSGTLPARAEWRPSTSWTLAKIVASFVSEAPPALLARIVDQFTGGSAKSDPYLDEIMRRGKEKRG